VSAVLTSAAPLARQISGWLEDRRDQMVEDLRRLALAESPSVVPEAQAAAFELLVESLAGTGYVARRISGRESGGCLLARPGRRRRGAPLQLLLGHIDTVWPQGTVPLMPVVEDGDLLSGPGVFDMKGGLVQGVWALKALVASGVEPEVVPVFLVNSDEEIGSMESLRHIRRLARRADRVLVLEPGLGPRGDLKTARKGVGHFEVTVRGRAAHAGLEPEKGASAILELAHVVEALFALNDPRQGTTVNVGKIDGGLRSNVVAAQSRAWVDVRVRTMEDARRLERALRELEPRTPGTSIEIQGGFDRPPMERTPGNRTLWRLARDLGAELGLELEQAEAGGASDGNYTSPLAPTLDGLGAVGEGAHAAHERVRVDLMPRRAALLALLLAAPALGGEPLAPTRV